MWRAELKQYRSHNRFNTDFGKGSKLEQVEFGRLNSSPFLVYANNR